MLRRKSMKSSVNWRGIVEKCKRSPGQGSETGVAGYARGLITVGTGVIIVSGSVGYQRFRASVNAVNGGRWTVSLSNHTMCSHIRGHNVPVMQL